MMPELFWLVLAFMAALDLGVFLIAVLCTFGFILYLFMAAYCCIEEVCKWVKERAWS